MPYIYIHTHNLQIPPVPQPFLWALHIQPRRKALGLVQLSDQEVQPGTTPTGGQLLTFTHAIYIYMCIYTYNIVPYLAIPMCKQCKRSQEPHRCILVPLHDVVSPAKSLSIETCWSQDVAHAHLYMKTAKQNQKFVDSKWSKFIWINFESYEYVTT